MMSDMWAESRRCRTPAYPQGLLPLLTMKDWIGSGMSKCESNGGILHTRYHKPDMAWPYASYGCGTQNSFQTYESLLYL